MKGGKKPNSHPAVVAIAITAVILFSSTISGLFPSSSTLDLSAYIPSVQAQQNQTGNMTTTGNNINATTAAASSYNEIWRFIRSNINKENHFMELLYLRYTKL